MYGAEYEVNSFNPLKKNVYDYDAVCAVCFVKARGSMLMIPARNDCPSGWTEEYHRYLMTAYYNHKKQRDYQRDQTLSLQWKKGYRKSLEH